VTTFAYVGRTRTGEIVRGLRAAETASLVAAALRREQVFVTRIRPARQPRRLRRVSAGALAIFTRQLSVMIDAGLPLVQSLELLASEEPDRQLAQAISDVQSDVEAGASLAEAMGKQKHVFDSLYTHLVAAGEAGGILDSILPRLSVHIEKQSKLRSQVRSAMVYPASVLAIAAVVVFVILWKVIPTFTSLFVGLNAQLPLPTRIVIWASRSLALALPVILIGLVGLSYGVGRYYATPGGRMRVDRLLLGIPLLGKTFRKVAVARFCRTFGTLTSSGIPVLEGLDITATTVGNAVVESALRAARGRIERGETIAAPLKASGIFPAMVAQMIAIGERSGSLDTMLGKVAEFYEAEVDVAVSGLLSILEPALVAGLGIVVGAIVISLYLPLFSLIGELSAR
jgi:type IV pilus assembly protein PilC